MIIKKVKILIIAVLLIFLSFTCTNDEAGKLVNSSITAGNLLSKYYDNLIRFTIEAWEMEAFNSSLREIDFPIEIQNEYQKTIESLEARKRTIDSFTKILPLLEEYIKSKSGEELKEIATELGNNINELKPLKENKIAIPSKIFGNLSGDIIDIVKYFEIKSMAKTLVQTLEKMKELFEKESSFYDAILDERNNKSLVVINYMIDNELVAPWGLIEFAPAIADLELSVDKKPAKDDKSKKALKSVLAVKYFRMKYLTKNASGELSLLLSDLIKTYNDFIQGKKAIFDNITFISKKLSEYFILSSEYYQNLKSGNFNQGTEIIYHGNSDTKVFHHPNCPYYFSKNTNVLFYSREEAISKGYSPCSVCKP